MSSTSKIRKKRVEFFLDLLHDGENHRVLDIGCQGGDLCYQLMQCGHEPYGIDVVEELVAEARSKYPQISFECANCEQKLPFADKHFDVVWAGDVIEHIRFTGVFVNEVNRVLKVGGLFVLTTPMHNRLKNLIVALYNFEKHFDPDFPHLRFYTLKSLQAVLRKRGFSIKMIKYFGRIALLANSMCVVSVKEEDKSFLSRHRF